MVQATEPILILDHLSYALQMLLRASAAPDLVLQIHPKKRPLLVTMITLQGHRVYQMGAPEVFQARLKAVKETLHSAHVYNSTMPGRLRTMTVEET
jgi:hypothetical protein